MIDRPQRAGKPLARRTFMGLTASSVVGATVLDDAKSFADTVSAPVSTAGRPSVSSVTSGVGEGATMVVVGNDFTSDAEVWLLRPPKDDPDTVKKSFDHTPVPLPGSPPSDATKATIVGEPDPHLLAAGQIGYPTIAWDPSAIPTVIWVKTSAGFSAPYVMNTPELFFLEDSMVVPGQAIRAFGRDLEPATDQYTGNDFPIALKNKKTGAVYWGQYLLDEGQEQANDRPYVFDVLFPDDIAPGTYEMSVHILYGAGHGWSNSLEVEVVAAHDLVSRLAREDEQYFSPTARSRPAPRARTHRVAGLHGDGIGDDTATIQAAIQSMARRGGGVVVLPSGAFAISRTIHVPPGVALAGAGSGSTRLTVSPTRPVTGTFPITKLFPSPSWVSGFAGDYASILQQQVPMVWLESTSGLQDVRVDVGRGASIGVLVGTPDPNGRVQSTFVKNTDIINQHRLLFRPATYYVVFGGILIASPTEGLTLVRNRILATDGLWFLAGRYAHRHARITNNVLESYPHNNSGMPAFNGISESVFEDNEFKSGAKAFTANMGTYRNWISGNTITFDGGLFNSSEIFASEDSGVLASGKVTAATADSVKIDGKLGLNDDQIDQHLRRILRIRPDRTRHWPVPAGGGQLGEPHREGLAGLDHPPGRHQHRSGDSGNGTKHLLQQLDLLRSRNTHVLLRRRARQHRGRKRAPRRGRCHHLGRSGCLHAGNRPDCLQPDHGKPDGDVRCYQRERLCGRPVPLRQGAALPDRWSVRQHGPPQPGVVARNTWRRQPVLQHLVSEELRRRPRQAGGHQYPWRHLYHCRGQLYLQHPERGPDRLRAEERRPLEPHGRGHAARADGQLTGRDRHRTSAVLGGSRANSH